MTVKATLAATPEWEALEAHYGSVKDKRLRDLFAADPGRAERFALEAAGLFLDYSKNRIDDETVRLLAALARARNLEAKRDAMFAGEKINVSENRAVLHVALRAPAEREDLRRRRGRRPRGARRARPDGRLLRPGALGRLEGPHRQAHPQCRQYRHRRLASRAGDGLSRAARLQRHGA